MSSSSPVRSSSTTVSMSMGWLLLERLFMALKTLRREVVFVRFPDENHELSRSGKPRHRLERFRIILDWFAKYL